MKIQMFDMVMCRRSQVSDSNTTAALQVKAAAMSANKVSEALVSVNSIVSALLQLSPLHICSFKGVATAAGGERERRE